MSSSFSQRIAPFLDVVGAVLVFGSWIASNALSQHALNQANTHQAIIDRVRQFRLYGDFAHRLSDIQSDVARTRNLAEHATARSSGNEAEPVPITPSWTGMTATQMWEMNDFVDDLKRYARGLSSSEDVFQSIKKARSGVHEMSTAFRSDRDEYDRLVSKLDTATPDSSPSAVAMKELLQRMDDLRLRYNEAKESMLLVGDQLLRSAASKSEEASQVAAQFKRLSYALYTVGTMIILFGRAKNALSATKEHGNGGL